MELGDLTIIAGRNNTGKTYLAYTLYGFLKMWKAWLGIDTFSHLNDSPVDQGHSMDAPDLARISEQLRRDGNASFRIDKNSLKKQRNSLLRTLSRDFSKDAITQVFSSHDDDFESASINVLCDEDDSNGINLSPIDFALDREHYLSINYDAGQLVFAVGKTVSASLTASPSLPYDLDQTLSHCYLLFLLLHVLPTPFILSAERFGISLFYKELDFTKNQLVDLLQKLGDDKSRVGFSPFLLVDKVTSRYALPIKDNIDYTRSIPNRRAAEGELWTAELFGDIKEMTAGYYKSVGDEIRFISRAGGRGRSFNIPLHLASSSVRGLSDLYFFLRHEAKRTDLLIIDEPESHLDTSNQIELARLLARCVRAGLRVLITTHSDYLIKEINNLVMLAQDFESKDAVLKKLRYTADDALDPSSIRAYVAENSGLTRCEIDRFGIDMPVFDKAIDSINEASIELASHLQRTTEA